MNPITLSTLAAFPQLLEAHYAAVPSAFRNWAPPSWEGMPSEHLSAIEQVCHVRDIEIEGYHVRFGRILNEDTPILESLDSEGMAIARSNATADASAVFAAFREARATTVALIAGLAPEQWSRTAVFEGYGPLTVRSLVHFLCSHDQQHLAGLQWLLGKIEASPTAPDAATVHVERAAHLPLVRVDLTGEAATVTQAYKNWIVVDVNDHCIRLAVMIGEYRWHQHPRSDECFLVLEGRLEIDLADGRTIDLGPGEVFTIPAGVRHRTRSRERTVNLCLERASAYTDVVFEDGESGG